MYKRSLIFTALALAMACRCAPLLANEMPTSETTDQHLAPGINEVGDDELATMRGRYTAGDNTVVWFGVEMVSTWQTNTGQTLQSAMTVSMNFSKNPNRPQVTFVPTVTITTSDAPLPTSVTPSTINRSVQSGGVANVGGLTQSVQLAGDNNAATNVASLNIQNGGSAPSSSNSSTSSSTSTTTPNTSPPSSSASVAVNSPTANTSSSTTTVASNNSSNAGSTNNVASNNSSNASNTNNVASSNSNNTSNTNSIASNNSNSASSTNNAASAGNSTTTTPSTITTNTGVSTPTGRTATAGNATASSTYSNNSAEVSLSVTGQGNVSQWIHAGNLGQTIALTTDNQVVTNQMIVSLVTQSIASTTSQVAHSLAQSMNLSHTIGH
ncbi:hypothetical protein [Dyella psychrodurans]|uniref:Uncharacterized protein n=1 Tax=Dyella psychrodurans TaxID=1927960 RepID=A0A370WWV3_9GAMM|nr:hypothetical protein [Dyella psychrodurans]RDS80609.1 hypothetical protein DWU99_18685 [Dyella psychrodurans]